MQYNRSEVLFRSENIFSTTLRKLHQQDPELARIAYFDSVYSNNRYMDDYEENIVRFSQADDKNWKLSHAVIRSSVDEDAQLVENEIDKLFIACIDGKVIGDKCGLQSEKVSLSALNDLDDELETEGKSAFIDQLIKVMPFVEIIWKNNLLHTTPFNDIIELGVTSLKKAIQHTYKVPYPIGMKLHMINNPHLYEDRGEIVPTVSEDYLGYLSPENFNHFIPVLDNVMAMNFNEFADEDFMENFLGCFALALTLKKRVNCGWTPRKFKETREQWHRELINERYKMKNRHLHVAEVYTAFAEFSGYEFHTQTRHLAFEGLRQSNCAINYRDKVDNGVCGMYHHNSYTIELRPKMLTLLDDNRFFGLEIFQIKHTRNEDGLPAERKEIEDKVNAFNDHLRELFFSDNTIYRQLMRRAVIVHIDPEKDPLKDVRKENDNLMEDLYEILMDGGIEEDGIAMPYIPLYYDDTYGKTAKITLAFKLDIITEEDGFKRPMEIKKIENKKEVGLPQGELTHVAGHALATSAIQFLPPSLSYPEYFTFAEQGERQRQRLLEERMDQYREALERNMRDFIGLPVSREVEQQVNSMLRDLDANSLGCTLDHDRGEILLPDIGGVCQLGIETADGCVIPNEAVRSAPDAIDAMMYALGENMKKEMEKEDPLALMKEALVSHDAVREDDEVQLKQTPAKPVVIDIETNGLMDSDLKAYNLTPETAPNETLLNRIKKLLLGE